LRSPEFSVLVVVDIFMILSSPAATEIIKDRENNKIPIIIHEYLLIIILIPLYPHIL
jgi:hypothetical protein